MKEEILQNITYLTKQNLLINREDNPFNYKKGDFPFLDYVIEDKSKHSKLSDSICPMTNENWIDKDNDFLIGDSGGILMKIDFIFVNTDCFSRVADFYDSHDKQYTLAPVDSEEWFDFWDREESRRKKGVIGNCKLYFKDIEEYFNPKTSAKRKKELLHPLRITGAHYNYLNYGRIERTPNEKEKAQLIREGAGHLETIEGFPRFWDGDYWNFKIDELIANNKYNLAKAKARRKGFSYKRGSQAANTLNLYKNITVILAADIIDYLTNPGATSQMVKRNLDWYETQTDWARGYLSENLKDGIELGYKKSKDGQKKYGYRSKLLSLAIGRNESAGIGTKALEIDIEEAGKCPNLQNFLNVTRSNNESGRIKVGTIRIYGTAGTKNSNWEDFSNLFYNPLGEDMLPMENVWSKGQRYNCCGFFFPQSWCYEPYIYDGNSLLFTSFNLNSEDKEAAKNTKKGIDYTVFCGQRADTPEEAFISTSENMFASPELNAQVELVKHDPQYQFYRDGWYVNNKGVIQFLSREQCIQQNIFGNNRFHEYVTKYPHKSKDDTHGCIREYYPPRYNNGDEYFISIDAFKVDKEMKAVTDKHSLYSIKCWTYQNTSVGAGKRIQAAYCGRLNTMEDCDRISLYMALRYNAKVLVEAGTGETISNFKKWGYRRLLLKDPTSYIDRKDGIAATDNYGIVIGDGDKKMEGLRMIKDHLYEITGYDIDNNPTLGLHHIYDLPLLLELQNFSITRNADRVSDMIVAEYEFKKRSFILEQKIKTKQNNNSKQSLFNRLNI